MCVDFPRNGLGTIAFDCSSNAHRSVAVISYSAGASSGTLSVSATTYSAVGAKYAIVE